MASNEPFTPTIEQARDAYVRAMRNAFIASAGEHGREFDRMIARIRADARRDLLPEGAKWFPDEGGIVWNGEIYYPADYVLTRNDIADLRAEAWDEAMKLAQTVVTRRTGNYETFIDLVAEPNPHYLQIADGASSSNSQDANA